MLHTPEHFLLRIRRSSSEEVCPELDIGCAKKKRRKYAAISWRHQTLLSYRPIGRYHMVWLVDNGHDVEMSGLGSMVKFGRAESDINWRIKRGLT
jgi:hypothetical protein